MTLEATAKSERVYRARRWASRALFALGGAVAGTAAAWALAGGSAEASHLDFDYDSGAERSPISELVVHAVERPADNDLVREGIDRATEALRTGDRPAPADDSDDEESNSDDEQPAPIHDGAESAHQGADEAESFVRSCGEQTGSAIERLLGSPEDPFEENPNYDDWQDQFEEWFDPNNIGELPGQPIVELPENPIDGGVVPLPGSGPDVPAPGFTGGTVVADAAQVPTVDVSDSGTSARGTPARSFRDSDRPSGQAPAGIPAGIAVTPFAPGSGAAGSGHGDGSPMATTFDSGNALAALAAALVRSGAVNAPFEPGCQPGVTPD